VALLQHVKAENRILQVACMHAGALHHSQNCKTCSRLSAFLSSCKLQPPLGAVLLLAVV
jgi:hypothetical protein